MVRLTSRSAQKLDSEWKRKRIDAETARQKLHQAKLLAMKGELVSKRHAIKQASFSHIEFARETAGAWRHIVAQDEPRLVVAATSARSRV